MKTKILWICLSVIITSAPAAYAATNFVNKDNPYFSISIPSSWPGDYNQFHNNGATSDVYRYGTDEERCSVAVIHMTASKKTSQSALNDEIWNSPIKDLASNLLRKFSKYRILSDSRNKNNGIAYKQFLAEAQYTENETITFTVSDMRFMLTPGISYFISCSTTGNSQNVANAHYKKNVTAFKKILDSIKLNQ